MSDAPDGFSLAGIIGGIITLGGAIGGAFRWLVRREAGWVKKLEARVDALEKETRDLWRVVNYVVPALQRHDPQDPALRMVSKILGDKFPIDPATPQDMRDMLNRI